MAYAIALLLINKNKTYEKQQKRTLEFAIIRYDDENYLCYKDGNEYVYVANSMYTFVEGKTNSKSFLLIFVPKKKSTPTTNARCGSFRNSIPTAGWPFALKIPKQERLRSPHCQPRDLKRCWIAQKYIRRLQ